MEGMVMKIKREIETENVEGTEGEEGIVAKRVKIKKNW